MKLILVYNADDGIFNAVTDTIHKVISPRTYECRLCQFTYGMTGMLNKWRRFIQSLPVEKEFLHRNEFRKSYPEESTALPAVFKNEDDRISALITGEEINVCANLDELIELVDSRVKEQNDL